MQINEGKETVFATFTNFDETNVVVGSVVAQPGCWSMIKGGFSADYTMPIELYFEVQWYNIYKPIFTHKK